MPRFSDSWALALFGAIAGTLVGGRGAHGDEAVLVYVARPEAGPTADPRIVSASFKRAVRAAGRTVVDGPIERALAAAAPEGVRPAPRDGGSPQGDGGAPAGAARGPTDSERASSAAIAALRSRPSEEGLIALGRRAHLDGIVVVALGGTARNPVWVAQRYDTASGTPSGVESVSPGASTDASAARLWSLVATAPPGAGLRALDDPRLRPRGDPVAPVAPTEKVRTPFYLSLWFWTGVFVVGLGALLIVSLKGAPAPIGSVRVDGASFTGH